MKADKSNKVEGTIEGYAREVPEPFQAVEIEEGEAEEDLYLLAKELSTLPDMILRVCQGQASNVALVEPRFGGFDVNYIADLKERVKVSGVFN